VVVDLLEYLNFPDILAVIDDVLGTAQTEHPPSELAGFRGNMCLTTRQELGEVITLSW
jgi:hypothetical protein